jgi:regulator of RNase E activity RraA
MFWAKNRPCPEPTTDLGEMGPVMVATSVRRRSAALRPSGATNVVVVVGGIVVVAGRVLVVVWGRGIVVVGTVVVDEAANRLSEVTSAQPEITRSIVRVRVRIGRVTRSRMGDNLTLVGSGAPNAG